MIIHPRIISAKFDWNWPRASEEYFLKSSMYLHYFVIISPWKRAGPFIWTNLNPLAFTQGCFVPSLVEIGPVVLDKQILKFCQCTVPETFYFPTWTVSECWANVERTLNARRVNGVWTQNASGAQTRALSERWMQDERSIRKVSCVFFSTKYLIIPR